MVEALGPAPQVADQHIQKTLEVLWRSNPDPLFLALQVAKYTRREPSLKATLDRLIAELDQADQNRVLKRLERPEKGSNPPGAIAPAKWYSQWLKDIGWQPLEVRADPELGRLAIGLNRVSEFLLWSVGRHYFGQPGHTSRQKLWEKIYDTRLIRSRRHFNRLLKAGAGRFWGLDSYGNIYLRGYVKVSQALTRQALTEAPELVTTNLPGARDIYLPVLPGLTNCKAAIYAAWLSSRNDPKIARETLSGLFGVSKDTLRNWEGLLGGTIQIVTNYAQTALDPREEEAVADYLPDHCFTILTRRNEVQLRWQQPNRYRSRLKEHAHKGQSRKARTAAVLIAWGQPVEQSATDEVKRLTFDRSHRVPKRYFDTAKQLRAHYRRLARKGLERPPIPRYVFRGTDRRDCDIYELSLEGEVHTTATERASVRKEAFWKAQEWRKHQGWLVQQKR